MHVISHTMHHRQQTPIYLISAATMRHAFTRYYLILLIKWRMHSDMLSTNTDNLTKYRPIFINRNNEETMRPKITHVHFDFLWDPQWSEMKCLDSGESFVVWRASWPLRTRSVLHKTDLYSAQLQSFACSISTNRKRDMWSGSLFLGIP